jgi:hypothetical protein
MSWTGWDGSVWDLCGGEGGVAMLAGVRGLNLPPSTQWRSQSPAVSGARFRGLVHDARECFWPVKVWNDAGSQAWVEHDRAFWATLNPAKTGVWSVTLPDGSKRSLTLRLSGDGDPSFSLDPTLVGWATYGLTFLADDPFWAGEEVSRSWKAATPSDFFNGGAKAPSFNISPGSTLGSATLSNPGDVETHVTWLAYGPFDSVTVGVDGRTVEAPISAAEGQVLEIDTNPAVQAAFLDGVDVTAQLTKADFATLPPGEDVTLSLSMTGAGWVEAKFTPKYLRAW